MLECIETCLSIMKNTQLFWKNITLKILMDK